MASLQTPLPKPTSPTLQTLPPEIRTQIYTHYLATVYAPQKLDTKADSVLREPALTRTCRRVRSETLPIWYALQRVSLFIFIKRSHTNSKQEVAYERRVWHERLSDEKIHMLRRVKVIFYYRPQYAVGMSYMRVTFDVDMFKRGRGRGVQGAVEGGSFEVRHTVESKRWEGDMPSNNWDVDSEVGKVTALLKRRLEELVVAPGVGKLGKGDLDRLARIVVEGDCKES